MLDYIETVKTLPSGIDLQVTLSPDPMYNHRLLVVFDARKGGKRIQWNDEIKNAWAEIEQFFTKIGFGQDSTATTEAGRIVFTHPSLPSLEVVGEQILYELGYTSQKEKPLRITYAERITGIPRGKVNRDQLKAAFKNRILQAYPVSAERPDAEQRADDLARNLVEGTSQQYEKGKELGERLKREQLKAAFKNQILAAYPMPSEEKDAREKIGKLAHKLVWEVEQQLQGRGREPRE